MGKVLIIGDSTCDMPPEWRKKLDVGFMPLPVNLGDEPKKDMLDVFPEDLYAYTERTGKLCTTSAPNSLDYVEFWGALRKEDPDCDILHFHISSKMTSTDAMADLAAKEFERVWSIDTQSVSVGVALLMMEACRMRDEGKGAEEIFEAIEKMKSRVRVGFVVSTVDYLVKGGRCTKLAGAGASLLKIRPAIDLIDGQLVAGKRYRGSRQHASICLAQDLLSNGDVDPETIYIANTSGDEEANQWMIEEVRRLVPDAKNVIASVPGCSVSVHCGPGCIGIAYLRKEDFSNG
ncbi:MAG: DegV family protein [Lachnospiraceae bacterium]|nr:DegV family protein [Lachnospiraceae bacterium]